MPATASDRQLMASLSRGDLAAFSSLVQRYQARLLRFATAAGVPEHVALSIVRQAFGALFTKRRHFSGPARASTLLFGLAVGQAASATSPAAHNQPAPGPAGMSLQERRNALRQAFRGLAWESRLALLLVFFENLPEAEAGLILKRGAGEAWDLAAGALADLRAHLGPGFFGSVASFSHFDSGQILAYSLGRAGDSSLKEHVAGAKGCTSCKKALLEAEALKALYLETAPEVPGSLASSILADASRSLVSGDMERGEEAGLDGDLLQPGPAGPPFSWTSLLPVLAAGAGVVCLGALLYFRTLSSDQAPAPDATPAFPSAPSTTPASEDPRIERAAKELLIAHSHRNDPLPTATPFFAPLSGTAGSLPMIQVPVTSTAKGKAAPIQAGLEIKKNRFNPDKGESAFFLLTLPSDAPVEARFMDTKGRTLRLLKTTLSGPAKIPITWNGTDAENEDADAGTYYLRVITPWFSRTEKIELTRK